MTRLPVPNIIPTPRSLVPRGEPFRLPGEIGVRVEGDDPEDRFWTITL